MRPLALVALVLALAAASSASGAAKTKECNGLQVCVPVIGPWVVVPTAAASVRPQTSFVLSCPKGYIVGGLDAELSSRALDVTFDARLGAPPGVDDGVAVQHEHRAQTVQVLSWNALSRHAVSAASSTSSGWNGLTPSISRFSGKP